MPSLKTLAESRERFRGMAAAYASGLTQRQVAAEFGVVSQLVGHALKFCGVTGRPVAPPKNVRQTEVRSERQPRMAEMYRLGMSGPEIARHFGVTSTCVYEALAACGVKAHSCEVDHDYFAAIDGEEKAYWLGFLAADGCVCDRKGKTPTISLTLATRDAAHVERFRACIGSTHALTVWVPTERSLRRKNYSGTTAIQFGSAKMATDLARCGVVPRKSLIAEPWDGPPELMRHYWRGAVDGDGCISRNGDRGTWTVLLCGSRGMVEGFLRFAEGIRKTRVTPRSRRNLWSVAFQGRTSPPIIRRLYEGAAIALPRKARLAEAVAQSLTASHS